MFTQKCKISIHRIKYAKNYFVNEYIAIKQPYIKMSHNSKERFIIYSKKLNQFKIATQCKK